MRLTRRFTLLLAALALTVVLFIPGAASAAPNDGGVDQGTIVQLGRDVYLAPGDTADVLVVIGGNATVAGEVRTAIVAVGGNVRVEPGATVGTAATGSDLAVLSVGGTVTTATGTEITGRVLNTGNGLLYGTFDRWVIPGFDGRIDGVSMVAGWLVFTAFFILVALLAALLMPRQVTQVRDRLSSSPWACLGWGALTALVFIPLASLVLILSVVGILALVPALMIALPLVLFFGFVAVSALVGGRLAEVLGGNRNNLPVAAVIGVAIIGLLNLVPFAGAVALAVVWTFGLGATVLAVRDTWQKRRAARSENQALPPAPTSPAGPESTQPPAEPLPQA